MDTLKGFIYLETCGGIENWCLAVEDPQDHTKTRIIKCKGKKARNTERNFCRKRGGMWKFKAHRFTDLETEEKVEKRIEKVIPGLPENLYSQIPISELKKLKLEWID